MPTEAPLPGSNLHAHTQARRSFDGVLTAHGVSPAAADRIRGRLEDRYRERGRHYHDLSHVAALVGLVMEHRDRVVDADAVILAIWYHDAVYRSRRQTNEEESAELARSELTPLLPAHLVEAVVALIRSTQAHQPAEGPADAELFLDFDLSILGSPSPVYARYTKAIRAEYRWVPAFIYRTKRAEVLQRFLERPSIYLTKELQQRFEELARENLSRELALLRK